MRLLVLHPEVAAVECSACCRWLHGKDWKPVLKGEPKRPVPRRGSPPCRGCPKIEPGVEPRPENATRLTPEFWSVWHHYHGCAAVNWQVPDATDPLVRQNAAVIRSVLDARDRSERGRLEQLVLTALTVGRKGR